MLLGANNKLNQINWSDVYGQLPQYSHTTYAKDVSFFT